MLRDRSLLALVSAELISRLGSQLTNLALPWFVLVTTGSETRMGLVFAVALHGAYLLAAALATVAALNFVQAILASPPAVAQEAA